MPTKPSLTFAAIPGSNADIKVLNYALALEATEADLYRQALIRLTTGGTINGVVVAGLGVDSQQPDVKYITQFALVENQHRDFLANALGSQAITLTALSGATFDFKIGTLDRAGIVDLLRNVEATGVQAYLGAIPFFGTKTYLAIAGGIQATEARHTSVITATQNALFGTRNPTAPLALDNNGIDSTMTPDMVLAAVSGPNGYIILP